MRKLTITTLLWLFPVFAAGFQSPTPTPTPSNGPGSSDQGGPRRIGPGGRDQGGARANDNKMPQSDPATSSSTITQDEIQSAIEKDPALAGADVTVQVTDKKIDLAGTAPTKDAKDTAERIAKENSGGIKVKNHLKVAAAANKSKKSDKSKGDLSNPK